MANDFLSKVYDKYEHRDFIITDDNLNPKREIRASGTKEFDAELDKSLAEISKKLLKIKETYRTAMYEPEEDPEIEADTSPSELVAKSKTLNDLKNSILAGGGIDDSIFKVYDYDNSDESPVIDALIDEIDRMIPNLIGRLPKTKASNKISAGAARKSEKNKADKSSSDYDLLFGDRFNCLQYENDPNSIVNTIGTAGKITGTVSVGDSGTFDDVNDIPDYDDSEDSNILAEKEQKLIDSLWDENSSSGTTQDEQESAAMECAINQLGILKAILVILKIIKIYQKIMLIIGAIMQIINITQLAAGAWLNPTNFAKIAQLIAELAIALLAQIIAQLIQMLWDLLNEECSVKQAMSVWKEIIQSMNAAGQVFDETGKAITLTQNNIVAAAKAKNHLEELAKQVEEQYSLANIKKEAGAWAAESWKDINNIDDGFKQGIKNGLKSAKSDIYGRYVPDDLQKMIGQTVNAANSLQKKYEKLSGTKVKTPAVEKAIASLKGLKEE